MGLASRGLCPALESAEGTWARLFGGAVRRRRWEQTVSARTHTHRSQREEGDGEKTLPL